MKKLLYLFAIVGTAFISSCEGPEGPQGPAGSPGGVLEAEVFELNGVNFAFNADDGYNIYRTLNPNIQPADVLLIYRLSGLIDSQTPIWQQIPKTLYLSNGNEVDYDFDFSAEDFKIYAGGTFDLTSEFTNNQTFRIVIIPGAFSDKSSTKKIDLSDYNAVVKAYNIKESDVKTLK